MADHTIGDLSDAALEAALRDLGSRVAWPSAQPAPGAPDVAMRVRARIVAAPARSARPVHLPWRPARRAVVLALAALLVLAAVAAAVAFGVPGIRLSFGTPPATPPPSSASSPAAATVPPGLPGAGLSLGTPVEPGAVDDQVPFRVRLPADPGIGGPDAAYVSSRGEVTFVWAPGADLPTTADPGVGLLLTQFRGRHDPEAITKIIDSGTNVERVTVGDGQGFWIDGAPHFSFYVTPEGEIVEATRRWVGDALIWSEGQITYRLETSLGREAAIAIAETLE